MEEKRCYVYSDFGHSYPVALYRDTYVADGSTAVILEEPRTSAPIARLTVCLDDTTLGDREVYLDTNNCPSAELFMVTNNLATPTGVLGFSGFCAYPRYRLTDTFFEQSVTKS